MLQNMEMQGKKEQAREIERYGGSFLVSSLLISINWEDREGGGFINENFLMEFINEKKIVVQEGKFLLELSTSSNGVHK